MSEANLDPTSRPSGPDPAPRPSGPDPGRGELERRIVDLEIRAAFQSQTIEALDGVVREFAARVEALERTLAGLREEVAGEPWRREPVVAVADPEDLPAG